jgi:signal peptidase II
MANLSSRRIRWAFAGSLLICCVGCDQVTKHLATETLPGRPPQSFVFDTVRLEYALNSGGFLSLGANIPPSLRFWVFVVLDVLLLAVGSYVLASRWNMPLVKFAALVFLVAGGIGNLIDRALHHGLVTDFANLGVGPVRTGIFNVADVAITLGVAALLIASRGMPRQTAER